MYVMPYIRVSDSTLRVLRRLEGFIAQQEGERVSHDQAINVLLMAAKFGPEMFPHWPVWSEIREQFREMRRRGGK
jgi:hypothetical protein